MASRRAGAWRTGRPGDDHFHADWGTKQEPRNLMPTYRIEIHTGSLSPHALAGSDARVHLTLFGTEASTDELVLDGGAFGVNGVDAVSLALGELGELRRLRVRHDDAGVSPAWFLDRISVCNEESGQRWTFPCHRWLARHEDDGETERTLDAVADEPPCRPG